MIALIYVSKSGLRGPERDNTLDNIMVSSISRNTNLEVTGHLIASPGYFAQLLEGPVIDVADIMSSIRADPRHSDVRIVQKGAIDERCCPRWRMTKFVGEAFGRTVIDPLLMAAHARDDAQIFRLKRLFDAFNPASGVNAKPAHCSGRVDEPTLRKIYFAI